MYKFANQIIDVYDDPYGDYLRKFASEGPDVYVMTPEEKARLADDDYALCFITKTAEKLPKFPINTRDNTWLSNKMFPETFSKLSSRAASRAACFIKKACEWHGISPCHEVRECAAGRFENNLHFQSDDERPAALTKTASPIRMDKIADVNNIAENYTHAQYALSTPAHVKIAARYFEEKHEKILDREARHKYATALQLRAEDLGMSPLDGAVAKYASDAYSAKLAGNLAARRRLLDGDDGNLRELDKLASAKDKFTPYQFAQILNGIDKKAGLSKYYDSYIDDPYRSTFSPKVASDKVVWMDKLGSRKLTESEIVKVVNDSNPKIAEYFGKKIAADMKTDPVPIFDSLPNDAKEIIANIHDGLL